MTYNGSHLWVNCAVNATKFVTKQDCQSYINRKLNEMSLFNELKSTTNKVREEQERLNKLRLAKVEKEKNEQFIKDSSHAEAEYSRIVTGCKNAAEKGKSKYVAITRIPKTQYDEPFNYGKNLDFSLLKGWLAILHNKLMEDGIEPVYKYCYDGCGIESWYNMEISWNE